MALEDLNPAVRVEEILDGADIEPATRLEYFMKKAANEVPKPAGSSDAGKAVLVNEEGDGYELGEAGGAAINVTHTMVIEPPNPPVESYDVVTPVADVSSIIASGKTCRVIITDSTSGNENELIMVNNGSGLSSVITTGLSESGVVLKVDQIYVENGEAVFNSNIVDVSAT